MCWQSHSYFLSSLSLFSLLSSLSLSFSLFFSLTLFLSLQNVGYVYGSSTRGQRSVYQMGLTGIPVSNCNNNCSTGSTALYQSRALVAGGMAQCTLALGFEKMQVSLTFDLQSILTNARSDLINISGFS